MKVTLIDYGMGNLRSVRNAFESIGADVEIAEHPKQLASAERIVMPGVGAFGVAMEHLHRSGWVDALNDSVRVKSKPFLGICLGMQVLAAQGTEGGLHNGLGWISGTVNRLRKDDVHRIPHMGWNDVLFTPDSKMYAGLGESQAFYFVHSYILCPESPDAVNARCHYTEEFTASIEQGNVWATQFHPEKSHKIGINVLQNFLKLN